MADPITFDVIGLPGPQGSKRPVGRTRTGRTVMIESSAKVRPWRQDVAAAALATAAPQITGPVALSVTFRFLRPKGHYGARGLRPSAPVHMRTRPDLDKLLRSTCDALTGPLLREDSQVSQITAHKRYCCGDERPGALITVIPLG